MYRYLDRLLEQEKKVVRTEFNRLGVMGFDELNVSNTRTTTQKMFDRFLDDNEAMYLRVAKKAYKNGVEMAKAEGYEGTEEANEITGSFVLGVLGGYNLVTGYLYAKEAERKRLRLNEQILTAREFSNRQMYHDGLRKSANLWWTQTAQYGISMVDEATLRAFRDMGVEEVRWVAADDEKTCSECNDRDGKVYKRNRIPQKPHYGCRCYVVPVKRKE